MRAGRGWRVALPVAAGLCAALLAACSSAGREDPIARLSAEEAFAEGQRFMEEEKYGRAQPYFAQAFQVAPNSEVGREALLLEADALFLTGGEGNYLKAEAKYRDFLNRFPTSERGDYAQYQLARSLEERMRHPDRDQAPTRNALGAYEDLIELYPTSSWVDDARLGIARARLNLAEHEFMVGRFSLRRGFLPAAVGRFETLLELYAEYPDRDRALWCLGIAYWRQDDGEGARHAFERLRNEHPDSPYVRKIPKKALQP